MDYIIEAAGKLVVIIGMGTVVVCCTLTAVSLYASAKLALIRACADIESTELESKQRLDRVKAEADIEKVGRG